MSFCAATDAAADLSAAAKELVSLVSKTTCSPLVEYLSFSWLRVSYVRKGVEDVVL